MTERIVLEFTVEPFVPTEQGPHVLAPIEAARSAVDDEVEVGPFGTTVTGPADRIVEATARVVEAALANGATRVSLQISTDPDDRQERP